MDRCENYADCKLPKELLNRRVEIRQLMHQLNNERQYLIAAVVLLDEHDIGGEMAAALRSHAKNIISNSRDRATAAWEVQHGA